VTRDKANNILRCPHLRDIRIEIAVAILSVFYAAQMSFFSIQSVASFFQYYVAHKLFQLRRKVHDFVILVLKPSSA